MASFRCWLVRTSLVMTSLLLLPAQSQALQDPTRPSGFRAAPAEPAPAKAFDLNSIIIGPDRKVAVINGRPRQEGQTFEGVRLRQIYTDRVELIDQGRVRILKLDTLPQVRSSQ